MEIKKRFRRYAAWCFGVNSFYKDWAATLPDGLERNISALKKNNWMKISRL